MQNPRKIEFGSDCLELLISSLLLEYPNEGCALLIGDKKTINSVTNQEIWEIDTIWPCCNIWEPETFKSISWLIEKDTYDIQDLSRENRFAIDPQEQLHANRWARENELLILGSAHSHTSSQAIPSKLDIKMSIPNSLLVIVDQFGQAKIWWMGRERNSEPFELPFLQVAI